MLSILIPIYNFNVTQLVQTLAEQCAATSIAYEIICYDDGSTPAFKTQNSPIQSIPNVNYTELPQNLGRSAIRNALAQAAQYEYLIFMDCDSEVVSDNYINDYLEPLLLSHSHPQPLKGSATHNSAKDKDKQSKKAPISPSATGAKQSNSAQDSPSGVGGAKNPTPHLIYGGRCYHATPPQDPTLYFHWKYGTEREGSTAQARSQRPYHSFMTNNFLIEKSIFEQIKFDEQLTQYGHEDTLFGMELMKRGVSILHIDNPLKHIGLETTDTFLNKTQKGIENLQFLIARGDKIETKLTKVAGFLQKLGLRKAYLVVFAKRKAKIEANLHSSQPNMRLFDLWKLGILLENV